ncbi:BRASSINOSTEROID INSENSITIVE 1-associated receptor kinase 1-like [Syzygium oleosum]|uniref:BRASSINOSTEROID INSENSITIVE 1-associated receptor kinase 1-like n=1 Tax=Syzygium oleosum TaxID=219896 RepID=UPI0011D21461|nr:BRASSINOSTEROID INSENSITIVE 1-associated receptor kinase 1-like [Syzygium oleosum]
MVFNLRTFSFTESVQGDPTPPPTTPPKSFSLRELRVATDNFSHDNFLAEARFGKLYRGRLADGSVVAVKRATFVDRWREEQFEAEVQLGSSTHPNVLCAIGFCRTKKELVLVYPSMINCSLAYHLRHRRDRSIRPLDWTTRKRIALEAARGLAHLHDQGNIKIVYRDISTSTILLNTQFEAVIGGFWFKGSTFPILNPPVRVSSSSQGKDSHDSDSSSQTHHLNKDSYVDTTNASSGVELIDPEGWLTGKRVPKKDVHAYGKMLLELISGQPYLKLDVSAYNKNLSLEQWIGRFMGKNELGRVIDPNLHGKYVEKEAEQLVRLALLCADSDPSVRPEMSEVVAMIESQMLGRDHSSRSNWSGSEYDSTPYYSLPPSPSLSLEIC